VASCEVRSSIDVENDQWRVTFEPVYRPSDYNTGFEYVKIVRQNGSKEPHDYAEVQSNECVS
jgi:hypothetical protein